MAPVFRFNFLPDQPSGECSVAQWLTHLSRAGYTINSSSSSASTSTSSSISSTSNSGSISTISSSNSGSISSISSVTVHRVWDYWWAPCVAMVAHRSGGAAFDRHAIVSASMEVADYGVKGRGYRARQPIEAVRSSVLLSLFVYV